VTAADRTVVIGTGVAGARCALELRALGYSGEVTVIGAERHLPYERPSLSKGYLSGTRGVSDVLVAPASSYEDSGIQLLLGRSVTAVDPASRRLTLDRDAEMTYSNVVFATGSSARRLTCMGAESPGVHVLRTIDDADQLRSDASPGSRAVVIGLGLIGAEVCATLVERGLEVIAVEPDAAPLQRLVGVQVGARLAALHAENGVELLLGQSVHAISSAGERTDVHLDSGASIGCDLVVTGVGALPQTALAIRAGIPCAEGILVDATGASAVPGVFAAGDVAQAYVAHRAAALRVEHWQAAGRQGRSVAQAVVGAESGEDDVPWFWSDQYDIQLQVLGWPDRDARTVVRGDLEALDFLAFQVREGRVVAVSGIGRGRELRRAANLIRTGAECKDAELMDVGVDLREMGTPHRSKRP
jgi:3-phenylpropionate/trans-cinnamate dioxygenase ferredoxin reductase subunit